MHVIYYIVYCLAVLCSSETPIFSVLCLTRYQAALLPEYRTRLCALNMGHVTRRLITLSSNCNLIPWREEGSDPVSR
uniref:Uncharacterized protein n=1 Tax=Anguilla anguilla TaxID=7936 RepID=A0A0E9RLA8_ANGAN